MNVPSLALCFSLVACLALAQGTSGVAVASGAGSKAVPEILAGAGLPPGVHSEAVPSNSIDARAVQMILDANGLTNVTAAEVAVARSH